MIAYISYFKLDYEDTDDETNNLSKVKNLLNNSMKMNKLTE